MRTLAGVALLLLSQTAAACGAVAKYPSWQEMLTGADTAVVVKATWMFNLGRRGSVFRLDVTERIYGAQGASGKHVAAKERKFEERDWHDTLTFWRNRPAGAGTFPGDCEFTQFIDPATPHLLLLDGDEPYALEPISGDNDRWYIEVKKYFARRGAIEDLVIPMPDLLRRLKPESSAGCEISHYDEKSIDAFLSCVRRSTRPRKVPVMLHVDGREHVEIIGTGSEPSFTREQLVEKLGADFGFEETVTLRSLLEAQIAR